MIRKTLAIILTFCWTLQAWSIDLHSPGIHCDEDTARINKIIKQLGDPSIPLGKKIVLAAEALEGAGEDAYYRTDSTANLRLNVDAFNPLTFVNTATALAKASDRPGNPDWRTFAAEYENISCRKGEDNGFPSIMFHTSDWIIDNTARGNIREITEDFFNGVVSKTKSLDEMTRKRSDYAALADSATFETVRMTEMGFRTHRIPMLKKEMVKRGEVLESIKDGDIIIMVPNRDGIDWYDIGIVAVRDDGPHLIHLAGPSNSERHIAEEDDTLMRYFQLMTKYFQGFRIIRVLE